MIDPLTITNDPIEIEKMRKQISFELISKSHNLKSGDFTSISPNDLTDLFFLYDKYLLKNWFWQYKNYWHPHHSLSKRMTRSAGMCIQKKARIHYHYEIRIAIDIILNHGRLGDTSKANGIVTSNRLEALQVVYEHELCHLIEFIFFGNSNCSNNRFKKIAKQIFGHSSSYHELPTNNKIAAIESDLKIGGKIEFVYEGKILIGVLKRITKRATCIVYDSQGSHIDNNKNRYNKYYVPLGLLKKHTPAIPANSQSDNSRIPVSENWMSEMNNLLKEHMPQLAFQVAKDIALAGVVDAQRIVGNMYSNGEGTPVNHNEAMIWYLKAVENGDHRAMHNIGTLYYQGLGVEQDYCLASQWFRKAAIKGSAVDQYNLGLMYLDGCGVTQNTDEAKNWLIKAANQNYFEAQKVLDQIQTEKGKPVY